MHNYIIKDIFRITLKHYMTAYHMPVPTEWKDENKMTIFDKAYFKIIPDINGHKPEE